MVAACTVKADGTCHGGRVACPLTREYGVSQSRRLSGPCFPFEGSSRQARWTRRTSLSSAGLASGMPRDHAQIATLFQHLRPTSRARSSARREAPCLVITDVQNPRRAQALIQSPQAVHAPDPRPFGTLHTRSRGSLRSPRAPSASKRCLPSRLPARNRCRALAHRSRRSDAGSRAAVWAGARLNPARGAGVPLARRSNAQCCGLFTFAVLAAAWFGGDGPGLVAAVLAS